jgi:hypothetical protein
MSFSEGELTTTGLDFMFFPSIVVSCPHPSPPHPPADQTRPHPSSIGMCMPQSTTTPAPEPPRPLAPTATPSIHRNNPRTRDSARQAHYELGQEEKLDVKRLLTTAQAGGLMRLLPAAHEDGIYSPDLLHSGWYSTEDVADLIGVDASTLRRWRTSTPLQGPPFVRLTSRVTMYSVPDVEAWLSSRRVDPSAAA